jgi:hypothetical protein
MVSSLLILLRVRAEWRASIPKVMQAGSRGLGCELAEGISIGANTAVFSVVNSVMLRPLAYLQPGVPGLASASGDLRLAPSTYVARTVTTVVQSARGHGIAGAMALVLGIIGIYGVIS